MIRFIDGPAQGVNLQLRRAPVLLRVVCAASGDGLQRSLKWDALDQIHDTPQPGESIFVYRRVTAASPVLIRAARGAGGCYFMADYSLYAVQADERTLADNALWRAWCESIKETELGAVKGGAS